MMKQLLPVLISLFCVPFLMAQETKEDVLKNLESKNKEYTAIAQNIWDYAEMGYQEEQSSALLQKTLKKNGFTINEPLWT
ncbi:hypothetical protein [Cellulophaga algicola]|uniref:hypothetical protein n=1 Tax=Cellulophaga algicola TaxID=59600 RepID=UPI0002DFCACB|nr:hypothetical protein [Cellulophaga algicola]